MTASKLVLVVGGSYSYYEPFKIFGNYIDDLGCLLSQPKSISLAIFTGGEDVDPSLYGEISSKLTYSNSRRDAYEVNAFHLIRSLDIPTVGICRGAQFLCVMAGGKLYQHVNNHGGNHGMRLWDGREIRVSSTHHQMQRPPKSSFIFGWAEPRRSDIYIGENDHVEEKPEVEPECVFYKNINAVGLQYHPEMMSEKSEGFQVAADFVRHFLFSKRSAK